MQTKVNEAAQRKKCGYNCAQAVAVNVLGMINKDASKTMQGSRRIINRFKEQNGTVICKELKGLTDGVVKRECIDCVKDAASFLEDELK